MNIILGNGYFIEIDDYNHTLKQKYMGKNKKEEVTEYERTLGYFSNLENAIKCYLKCLQNSGLHVDLKEYLDLVRETNAKAVAEIKAIAEQMKGGV